MQSDIFEKKYLIPYEVIELQDKIECMMQYWKFFEPTKDGIKKWWFGYLVKFREHCRSMDISARPFRPIASRW